MDCSITSVSNDECGCWKRKDGSDGVSLEFPSTCTSQNCIYAYTKSSHTTFEHFKIQLENLHKFASTKVIKKMLLSLFLSPSKIKIVNRGFCFINFRCAADRDMAVEKLNGHVFKGQTLKARITRPAADPALLKRAKDLEDGDKLQPDKKRLKNDRQETDLGNKNPVDLVAPLWHLAYQPDQIQSKLNTAITCLLRLRRAINKVNNFKFCDNCLGSSFMSSKFTTITDDCCPITASPQSLGYRNKAEFTIGHSLDGKGPVIGCRLGKYSNGCTAVADPAGMPIFSEETLVVVRGVQEFLDFISNPEDTASAYLAQLPRLFREFAPMENLTEGIANIEVPPDALTRILNLSKKLCAYDLVSRKGHWCSATIRVSRLNDRLMQIEIHRDDLSDSELSDLKVVLANWFSSDGPGKPSGLTTLYFSVLDGISRQPGTFTDSLLFGKDTITEICSGLKFSVSKDAFFQVNTLASELLYEEIKRRCHLIPSSLSQSAALNFDASSRKDRILLDICCGTGTIGLCLAEHFEKVIGIELIPAAVENAKKNAEQNGITNVEFFAGRAELLINDIIRDLPADKEIVAILDPPRAGVHSGVIEAIRRCRRLNNLIYVSCDLAAATNNLVSFARPPSKKFSGDPFLPTLSSCVDLFPHTPNIEIILSLKRLSPIICGKEHQLGNVLSS